MSKWSKIFQKKYQHCQKVSNFKKFQKLSKKHVKIYKIIKNCQNSQQKNEIVKLGQIMFPHHSQRSQVSSPKVALCMSKVKVPAVVNDSVSDKVTYRLSCSGQLKRK